MRKLALLGLAAVFVAACDAPSSTQPSLGSTLDPDGNVVATDGVTASATGSGHVHIPGDGSIRKFTVSAVKRANGTVSGQYDLESGPSDLLRDFGISPALIALHGTITCMTVVGNSAYLGGTVDHFKNADLFFGPEMTGVAIELIDHSAEGLPDEISSVAVYIPSSMSTPEDYCASPAPGPVFPIDQGNIHVR